MGLKKALKRVFAVAMSVIVLSQTIPMLGGNTEVDAANTTSGSNYLCDVLGIDYDYYIQRMTEHEDDDYYLGTPYTTHDARNPNGDPGKNTVLSNSTGHSYGSVNTKGKACMNCTGFVWHALARTAYIQGYDSDASWYKGKDSKAYNTIKDNVIPGETGWVSFYKNKNIKRYYFNSKSAMLKSGVLQKGDIIWMFVTNEGGLSNDNHVGIFWGNSSSEDKMWHSIDTAYNTNTGKIEEVEGNAITSIMPKSKSTSSYVVIKAASNRETLTLNKKNASSSTNVNYSLKGAKYGVYVYKNNKYSLYSYKRGKSNVNLYLVTDSKGNLDHIEDSNGKTFSSDCTVTLPTTGTYYGHEVKAPAKFQKDTGYYAFKKSSDRKNGYPLYKLNGSSGVKDVPYIYLRVVKKSSTSLSYSKDAAIYYNLYTKKTGNANYTLYRYSGSIYTIKLTYDKSSKAYVSDYIKVPYGTYAVKESSSSLNYYTVDTKSYKSFYCIGKHNGCALYSAGTSSNNKTYVTDNPYIKLQIAKKSSNESLTNNNSCYSLAGAKY